MIGGIYGKRPDISIRQAGIYLCPAVTIVGGAKGAAAMTSGEDVTGGIYGKRLDISIRQAGIYLRPCVTIVGGAKGAAKSPCEDVAGCGIYGKRQDITTERTVGLLPEVLFMQSAC